MASQETQRKLLLTVAFAGAVTAWIAFRVSREEDKPARPDASVPQASAVDGGPSMQEASTSDASAPDSARDSARDASTSDSVEVDASVAVQDAAPSPQAAATFDAQAPGAGEGRAKIGAAEGEGALLSQLDLTAEARKPLLTLLAPTDAGATPKTMGRLPLPSGKLGIYGCTVHPYSEDREVLVPAGVYPVLQVASPLGEALVVKLLDAPWVSIKQVGRLDIAGEKLCLIGKEAAEQLEARGSLEDLLTLLDRDAGAQAQVVAIPKTKLAFAAIDVASGAGPIYLSYDAKGRTAGIVLGTRPK